MSNAHPSLHEQPEGLEDLPCDQVSVEGAVSWFTNHGNLGHGKAPYEDNEFIDDCDSDRKYNFFQGLLLVLPISLLLWVGIIFMILGAV